MTRQSNGLDFLSNAQLKKIPEKNEFEFSVFGRGFGECIVLGCGNGEYIVVDSFVNPCTGNPIAIDYLNSLDVPLSSIKKVVLTHWHADHIMGISKVLEAANKNVKIVLSPIISKEHFQKFVSWGIKEKKTSTAEFAKVYDFLQKKGRQCIKIANSDTLIYINDIDPKIEIFSLSPQDEDLIRYIDNIREQLNDSKVSLEYLDDNSLSIVLLIKFSKDGILLGGDLETTSKPNEGWNAVVNNYIHKDVKASVFKIPHHGSINGHHELVWKNMLKDYPFAVLTVYNRSTKLPKEDDISRIVKLSHKLYVIGNKSKTDKAMEHKLKKRMSSVKVEAIPQDVGMVRYRKNLIADIEPTIEYFGEVTEYKNSNI